MKEKKGLINWIIKRYWHGSRALFILDIQESIKLLILGAVVLSAVISLIYAVYLLLSTAFLLKSTGLQ